MKKIKIIAFIFIFCSLLLVGCKKGPDVKPPVQNPELPAPVIEAKSYITIGGYTTLNVTNYSSLDLFNISIEDPSILSLNSFNDLVGEGVGKTKVTFTHKEYSNVSTTIEIEVITKYPVLSLSTDKIAVGGRSKLSIRNLEELIETSLDDFDISIEDNSIVTLEENYMLKGQKLGSTKINIVSKINPLIKSSINIKVADPSEELILTCDYEDGIIIPGTIFSLNLLTDKSASEFKFAGGDKLILRIREDNTLVTVEPGITSITVYEIANPANSATFTITVEGESGVDYIAQFLDYALSQNGYYEGTNNHTKYGAWYNLQNEPWCAMFVSWCWFYSGLSNDIFVKYCSCTAGMQWCLEQGIFKYKKDYKPITGDIVFFLSAGMSHTGIVLYSDDEYLYTIEGNSSSRVGIWRWSLNDARITGYGVPKYPDYDGTRKDYSWVAEEKETGGYWWTNVSEKQDVM